jgi:hypothetical protein
MAYGDANTTLNTLMKKKSARARIVRQMIDSDSSVSIRICCAIDKKQRFDFFIELTRHWVIIRRFHTKQEDHA